MKVLYIGLSLVSNRWGRASPRKLHAEGRRLLRLLDRGHGGSGKIAVSAGGRPYFLDGHADFSIAHSGHAVAAAYSPAKCRQTGKPCKVGCDIQYVHPNKSRKDIAESFFSPEEQRYIGLGASPEEQRVRFYRIWALKECFLKMFGRSVFDIPQAPSFSDGENLKNGSAFLRFSCCELETAVFERYILAVGVDITP
ncbi:MAG: 4'-phosphopantetheinyl transferase superfamily protein [Spirochaetaceae bacterium]|nr:4'-phosphopantetheinyl transferase superfamily protein [Spirochaetaceae bacterium]